MSEQTINLPKHVGYIVDGNRRWAKKHGLPTYEGHLAGYNAIQDVARATFDSGVEYMSAYIFSTENWKRSKKEVSALMAILRMRVDAFIKEKDKQIIECKELIAKLEKEVERSQKKLGNEKFVNNAPEKVVEAERQKATEWQQKLAAAKERLQSLQQA